MGYPRPRWYGQQQEERDRERYPELDVGSFADMLKVDRDSFRSGQPLTSFGQTAIDTFLRAGIPPEERRALEVDPDEELAATRTPLSLPRAPTPEPLDFGQLQQMEQRRQADAGVQAFTGRFEGRLTPGQRAEVGPSDNFNLPEPVDRFLERGAREVDRVVGGATEELVEETGEALQIVTDGEAFINQFVNTFTGQPVRGNEPFDIREQEFYQRSPRLVQELTRALAPINVAAAGAGGGITASLRAAAQSQGRSQAAARALNGLAAVTEPFAARSFGGRLGREIAADVGFQEGFAQTEGLPTPVRFGAGLVGGVAGGLSPEIARGFQRATADLPAGLSVRDIGDDPLETARTAIFDGYRQERTIERLGIPERELTQGRAQQAEGVRRALDESAGLSGEELAAAGRAGASVEGTIRQTFAEPIELSKPQRDALFDELARMVRDEEIDPFEFLQAGRAVARLLDGEGLRPFELKSPALRNLVGDEVVETAAKRGTRQTLERADKALRNEPLITGRQRQVADRALAAQRKRELAIIDERIKGLEEPIDITRPTGARAILANPELEDVGRARREVEQLAERDARRTARETGRQTVRSVDQRIRELERVRAAEIKAFNDADAKIARETERFNAAAIARQENARTAAEARSFARGFRLKEAMETRAPNRTNLLTRVDTLMDRPVTGTPTGDVPRGTSGNVIGDRASPDVPRVPEELRPVVREAIDYWLRGTDAVLATMSDEGIPLVRAIQAQITGQLDSPYLTAALYRQNTLTAGLRAVGVDDVVAKQIADTMFEAQLARRFGDGMTEIRAGRTQARTAVRNRFRSVRDPVPTGEEFDRLVNDQLATMFKDRFGAQLLAQERRLDEQLALTRSNLKFTGIRDAVQQSKNTMFAIDASIFGIQVTTAFVRGGIPLMTKAISDILAALHLPIARRLYTEGLLNKQIQYLLDGVDQTALTSAFRESEGSLLQHIPLIGKQIDAPYMAIANRINDVSFGTILTATRNAAYEGELTSLHLLGFDVSDPLVRSRAAVFANNIGSSAEGALRGNRRAAEDIVVTSSRMTRARFNNIIQMAKVFAPGVSAEERAMGAMAIASTVGFTLVIGQAINDRIGIGDFEMDPSKPGFGLITVAGGRVIDLIPQDSVTRAFARSLAELKDGDVQAAGDAWLKIYMGSASIIGKVPTTLFGYGYEPGAGFKFGDLTPTGRVLNMAPLPPVVSSIVAEGWDSIGTALDTIGVSNFPESTFGEAERRLRDADLDPDELNRKEQREALEGLGVLDQLDSRRVAELREQADRGDRTAQALLLSDDLRVELNRIAEDTESKPEYRDRRRDPVLINIGAQAQYEDIWRGFGDSDDPIQKLAGERYELIDQVKTGTEVDFDALEDLQAVFDARLSPSDREAVLAFVNAVDPRDNPLEQELDALRAELGDSGWWQIDDALWEDITREFGDELQGAPSIYQFQREEQSRIRANARAEGFAAGEVEGLVRSLWASNTINQVWTDQRRERRGDWTITNQRNLELASQAAEWAFWAPPDDVESAFSAILGPAQ